MELAESDEIPSGQILPPLATTTPHISSTPTTASANIIAASSTTVADSSTTIATSSTSSTTPLLNPIDQQIQQHDVLKQLQLLNKQLSLLRANPTNNAVSVSLETITNLLNTVFPSTSNNASSTARASKNKKATGAKPQGRRPYPRDADGNIICPNKENQPKTNTKQSKKKTN